MESLGEGNNIDEDDNRGTSGEMIGRENKKLVKYEDQNKPMEASFNIFEDNKEQEEVENDFEGQDDDDLQIVPNSPQRPATSFVEPAPPTSVKQISSTMKLEIRPNTKPKPARNLPIVEDCEAEIILVVDNREKRNANDVNYFYDRFKASGIKIELRSLPLGDFLWIVRVRNSFEG
jgi:hypothetical protein